MSKSPPVSRPITDQIVEASLSSLEDNEAFNATVLGNIRDLAAKGKLASPKAVIEAISYKKE